MTRLGCHRFRSNEVRLSLSLIAYNLGNLWRRLVLPKRIENVVPDQPVAAVGENRRPVSKPLNSWGCGVARFVHRKRLSLSRITAHGWATPSF